mmetsp:Transcript_1500/g.2155  ORF Transcript_1500/g.2155 Transcript_1500/m.2155 type:complete len:204 (-) Transcript_1500:1003-1614(-)
MQSSSACENPRLKALLTSLRATPNISCHSYGREYIFKVVTAHDSDIESEWSNSMPDRGGLGRTLEVNDHPRQATTSLFKTNARRSPFVRIGWTGTFAHMTRLRDGIISCLKIAGVVGSLTRFSDVNRCFTCGRIRQSFRGSKSGIFSKVSLYSFKPARAPTFMACRARYVGEGAIDSNFFLTSASVLSISTSPTMNKSARSEW